VSGERKQRKVNPSLELNFRNCGAETSRLGRSDSAIWSSVALIVHEPTIRPIPRFAGKQRDGGSQQLLSAASWMQGHHGDQATAEERRTTTDQRARRVVRFSTKTTRAGRPLACSNRSAARFWRLVQRGNPMESSSASSNHSSVIGNRKVAAWRVPGTDTVAC
jgi:hypothetical protein